MNYHVEQRSNLSLGHCTEVMVWEKKKKDWFLYVTGANAMETEFRTTNILVSMLYNFFCVCVSNCARKLDYLKFKESKVSKHSQCMF